MNGITYVLVLHSACFSVGECIKRPQVARTELAVVIAWCKTESLVFARTLLPREISACKDIWPKLLERQPKPMWSPDRRVAIELIEMEYFSNHRPTTELIYVNVGMNAFLALESIMLPGQPNLIFFNVNDCNRDAEDVVEHSCRGIWDIEGSITADSWEIAKQSQLAFRRWWAGSGAVITRQLEYGQGFQACNPSENLRMRQQREFVSGSSDSTTSTNNKSEPIVDVYLWFCAPTIPTHRYFSIERTSSILGASEPMPGTCGTVSMESLLQKLIEFDARQAALNGTVAKRLERRFSSGVTSIR